MASVHLGIPLQVPDGLLTGHQLRVVWQTPAEDWHEFVETNVGLESLAALLFSFIDVERDIGWGDLQTGDALVGTLGDLLDLPNVGGPPVLDVVQRLTSRLGLAASALQATPIYVEVPDRMRWIKTQIVGKLGGVEDLIHTVNWMQDGAYGDRDVDVLDDAALQAFTNQVATSWSTAMKAGSGSATALNQMSSALQYLEVRGAIVEQTQATTPTGSNTGKINQVGRTLVRLFDGPLYSVGLGGAGLPFEVAACATLRTVGAQSGGASHGRDNRGRLYFGGLATSIMGTVPGCFDAATVNILGTALGAFYDSVHTATDRHAAIVSSRHLKALPITQIQMGVVPDVQTRRRRSQKENYAAVWSGQLDTVTVSAP